MFLQQWKIAGWAVSRLLEFAGTLRPLQYRDDLDDKHNDALTKKDLLERIADLYAKHMFTMMMRSDVEDFVEVAHSHFSRPDAVLLQKFHEYKCGSMSKSVATPRRSRMWQVPLSLPQSDTCIATYKAMLEFAVLCRFNACLCMPLFLPCTVHVTYHQHPIIM